MPTKAKVMRGLILAMVAAFAFQSAKAQSGQTKATAGATGSPDAASIIKAAADAMGMPRTGGPGGAGLPEVDVINRMEIWGSASGYEYHAALGYNPPAMRIEMTRTNPDGHTIQTVRDTYAWNESQIGAGLEPGRGTATPATASSTVDPTLRRSQGRVRRWR